MLGSPCSARLRSAMRRVIELQPSMARLYKKAERPMSLAEFALIDRIRARTLERDDILLGNAAATVALAATVIGYVSAPVSRSRRIAFAVSSLLLMAPGLAVSGTYDVLGLVGMGGGEMTLALDVALRAVGLVLFAVLLVENRRQSEGTSTAAGSPEPA